MLIEKGRKRTPEELKGLRGMHFVLNKILHAEKLPDTHQMDDGLIDRENDYYFPWEDICDAFIEIIRSLRIQQAYYRSRAGKNPLSMEKERELMEEAIQKVRKDRRRDIIKGIGRLALVCGVATLYFYEPDESSCQLAIDDLMRAESENTDDALLGENVRNIVQKSEAFQACREVFEEREAIDDTVGYLKEFPY